MPDTIDLNSDMGEGYGRWSIGYDEAIMPLITSANLACGGHAGDPNVMAATVRLAKQCGVAVGAHPSYPDVAGFGRRPLPMEPDEVERWVLYQIGALWAIARSEGVELSHVKAHGALYNQAATDEHLASAVARAVRRFSSSLLLFCLPGSAMQRAGAEEGLQTVREGFVDRAYEPNGLLSDRKLPGAVRGSPEEAARQALELVAGEITCREGARLKLAVDTLCLHSDTPGAPEIARAVRDALAAAGYEMRAPTHGS